MPRTRKRTSSEAMLNKQHRQPFKKPKIIDNNKWKAQDHKHKQKHIVINKWKCIECHTYNIREFVFCAKCAAEPPFILQSLPKRPKKAFKRVEPLFEIKNNFNCNTNNNHNHNKKQTLSGNSVGYPDYEIQFKHIADINARKYGKYLEQNIRREQKYHIDGLKLFLKTLRELHKNDIHQLHQQFRWKMNGIERDSESGDTILSMTMNHNESAHNRSLGAFYIGTQILALCECHFDEITDINEYFERSIHGMIEEIPRTTNDNQFKIKVIKDKYNALKRYKDNENNNNNENILSFDFKHETMDCCWILCVNNLSFYVKQLKHLDIFINATIYQLPYKVFDYIYNCNHDWMRDDRNDNKLREHIQILNSFNKLNDSQCSSIGKALIYPISLIQGPPGTGKTYTLAVLSYFILCNKLKDDSEVIVITAHSHSACDRIVETLIHHINPQRMTRFGAINKIGAHLRKYSFKTLLKKHSEYGEYLKFKKQQYIDIARDKLMQIAKNILMDDIDIVITTCYGCCNPFLMNNDISVSHLIIDEATQIVESEQLIAINLLRNKRSWNKTNTINNYYAPHSDSLKPLIKGDNEGIDLIDFKKRIIMIGDPKQLCPVVQSSQAVENGYCISMFERLLGLHSISNITKMIKDIQRERRKNEKKDTDKDIIVIAFKTAADLLRNESEYKRKQDEIQDIMDDKKENEELYMKLKLKRIDNESNSYKEKERNLINYTLLNVQYRMKKFMMRFCNENFYDSSIETEIKSDYVINGVDWNDDNKSVMLISLDYSEQIKTASRSFYNMDECLWIERIVHNVLNKNEKKIIQRDIGIICLHRAQVNKMKMVLNRNNRKDVEVNTIDGYQGKEKKLIILSFVRTDNTSTSFLANAQRCNVALSRAKYGLIVVAQLHQLKANRIWRKFAKFVERHNIIKVIHHKCSQ